MGLQKDWFLRASKWNRTAQPGTQRLQSLHLKVHLLAASNPGPRSAQTQGIFRDSGRENQLSHCQGSKAILIGAEEQSSECGQEVGDCAWTVGVHVICTLRR